MLTEVFRAFAEVTTDYVGLVRTIAKKLSEVIGDACAVSLVDETGRWTTPSAAHGRDLRATELLTIALCQNHPEAPPVDLRTSVLIPLIEPVALAQHPNQDFNAAVLELGIRGMLMVPLLARERSLGVLALFRYRPDSPPFTEEDRELVATIADHAALAISNAQLFESLQKEREKAKTFVALIENSTDMIAMADFAGKVLFINAAGRTLCGIPADVDAGTLTLAQFHTEEGLGRGPIIREKGDWHGDGELRHFGTGELIPTRVSSFLLRDHEGTALGYATVQHDVRETRRLETELRQAQKMEALGRLAGGVAHDFNNLLTVILSYAALLARELPADSRLGRDVEQISRAGDRAAELTRQLLAFSRRQVLEPKALDLGEALRSMEAMMRRLVGEDIDLHLELGADVPPVMVDAGQVEQVVMNLVVNARDAMASGGSLTLATSRIEPGLALLSVSDTGAGIDELTKAQMFEPFFTTKDRGKGTGLGLSTVMGIVEQSGGHVAVESAPGKGTTFRVLLPAATMAALPTPARTVTQGRGTGRILLVEDEEGVRSLVREVLRTAGYEVVDAPDGEAALAVVAGHIDLLLTDVIMPRMSGRQLAAKFLARQPNAQVLYMSGYPDDKLGAHGVLDPDVELIQKPLTPDSLLRRVRELLLRSR